MQTYKGSCHCGSVRYEVQSDLANPMECNCSMCSKKGTILVFVPSEQFKLIAGNEGMSDYQFNKKVIHHTFCKNCGVTSFVTGTDRKGNSIKAINVRCLEGVDIKSLKITQVDGKSF